MHTESIRGKEALRLLQWGDTDGAYAIVRRLLEYPATSTQASFRELIGIAVPICKKRRDHELAQAFEVIVKREYDPWILLEAAYLLEERREPAFAAGLLARADRMRSGEPKIVCALTASLEALMMNLQAAYHLEGSGLAERVPWCRYLLAYNALMSGDLSLTRRLLPALVESEDPDTRAASTQLAHVLVRLGALDRGDEMELPQWHAALSGAVLLHASSEQFEHGMRGRYALLFDEPALIKLGILRLRAVLEAAGVPSDRIYALGDRSSRILANAMARLWGATVEPWRSSDAAPGLIVAYDLSRCDSDVLEGLRHHHPHHPLFAHGTCWTAPPAFAPDFTTLLHQRLIAPWDAAERSYDPIRHRVDLLSDDEVPMATFVQDIVDADVGTIDASKYTELQLRTTVDRLRDVHADAAAGMFRRDGRRLPERLGSPIKSIHFL